MRLASILLACASILSTSCSRCPESRKPHLTSCTIFYTCVNVPGGGYVWVPSKCTEGLVFQPYLRMCVVPGDIWTCDTLSTEPSIPTTKRYGTVETTDTTDANYLLGYASDSSGFSETIDSSYVIDDFSDATTEAVTAYPLIEFEESDGTTGDDKGTTRDASYHKNYYEYTSDQEQEEALSVIERYKDIVDSHYKWLNALMSRLHVCKELSAAISDSLPLPIGDITTINPIQTVFASHNQRQNVSLNYPVQNHIEANQLSQNDKPTENNVGSQMDNIATTSGVISTESTMALLINDLDPDNNVIRIIDNIGNKRYFTIDGYRAVASRLTSPSAVSVVACTRNVRLPNVTDCKRYYMCDPKMATVVEFSCPLHTAFNANSHICEIESAKTCGDHKVTPSEIIAERENDDESSSAGLCREIGKIKDPASDSHYYICYNMPGTEDIKSIRMTCPNVLIFCQSKRVCTTRRLCGDASS